MEVKHLLPYEDAAQNVRYFNTVLYDKIVKRIQVPKKTVAKQNAFLFFPAILGWLLHAPVYYFLKSIIRKKTAGTVFYDSVLFGTLLLIYPLYLLLLALLLNGFGMAAPALFTIILLHPLTAWSSVHKKK